MIRWLSGSLLDFFRLLPHLVLNVVPALYVRLSEAEGFVDQVNRVGEETVGNAPSGVIRGCSKGTGTL